MLLANIWWHVLLGVPQAISSHQQNLSNVLSTSTIRCILWLGLMRTFEWHFTIPYVYILANNAKVLVFIAYHRLQASPKLQHFRSFLTYWNITGLLGCVAIGPQLFYFAYGISQYCPSLQAARYTLLRNVEY